MPFPRPGSGALTPALLCVALFAGLAVQVAWPVSTTFPLSERRAAAPMGSPVAAPIPSYVALLAAPLFSPDRRTAGAGVAVGGATASDGQRPMLIGVASDRRAGSAILRGADGAAHVLRLGETWRGWRLVAVGARGAAFDGPGGRFTAMISDTSSSGSAPAQPSSAQEARP